MPPTHYVVEFWRRTKSRLSEVTYVGADQTVVSGSNFLTGIIIARGLGIEVFGVFSLVWLGVVFAQGLQQALLLLPMMSMGPKQAQHERHAYYSAVALHQLVLGSALAAFIMAFWPIQRALGLNWLSTTTLLASAVCSFLVQFHDFLRRCTFVIGRHKSAFLGDVTRYGIQVCMLAVLLLPVPRIGLDGVLLVIALGAGLGCAALGVKHGPFRLDAQNAVTIAKRHLHLGKWLLGSVLLQWTSGNLFLVATGALLGPIAVGALKASQTLLGVTNIYFLALDTVMPARAASIYHTDGQAGLDRFVRILLTTSIAVMAPAGVLLAGLGGVWLTLLFGSEYSGYGYLVGGYALMYLLMACLLPYRYALLAMERSRPIFIAYAVASAIALVTFYPLISQFGSFGAVLGIALCEAALLVCHIAQYRSARDCAAPVGDSAPRGLVQP